MPSSFSNLGLRPETAADVPLLEALYASAREEELSVVPWAPEQRQAFLHQQFEAQHRYYIDTYEGATYDIITLDDEAIGRLYVARWPAELRIMDIALLPAYRGRGIGTHLTQSLLDEARRDGRFVSLHVEQFNPALHLYQRLGFEVAGENGPYLRMEWRPST